MNTLAASLHPPVAPLAPARPTRVEAAILWVAHRVARSVHDRMLRRAMTGPHARRIAEGQRTQTLTEAHLRGLLR